MFSIRLDKMNQMRKCGIWLKQIKFILISITKNNDCSLKTKRSSFCSANGIEWIEMFTLFPQLFEIDRTLNGKVPATNRPNKSTNIYFNSTIFYMQLSQFMWYFFMRSNYTYAAQPNFFWLNANIYSVIILASDLFAHVYGICFAFFFSKINLKEDVWNETINGGIQFMCSYRINLKFECVTRALRLKLSISFFLLASGVSQWFQNQHFICYWNCFCSMDSVIVLNSLPIILIWWSPMEPARQLQLSLFIRTLYEFPLK